MDRRDQFPPHHKSEDDPLQSLIGKQLRTLYDSVLAEPIPDKFVELLTQLDDVPVPTKQKTDPSDPESK